uniref:Large ribosomal subunit protein uL29 n=1 Tax=Paramormyrops kingsleyae TaxID=1676925 RepID=A0A3B3S430_9TELE
RGKAPDLWNRKEEDVIKQLDDLKMELSHQPVSTVTGDGGCLCIVRKSMARVLSVIHQAQEELEEVQAKPLYLRPKKMRVIRRRLKLHRESLMTKETQWMLRLYSTRMFAVKM